MNDHDVIATTKLSHDGLMLTCACGRVFVGTTREKAREAHQTHFGLEQARAALRNDTKEDTP